jgi:hypothetical protein
MVLAFYDAHLSWLVFFSSFCFSFCQPMSGKREEKRDKVRMGKGACVIKQCMMWDADSWWLLLEFFVLLSSRLSSPVPVCYFCSRCFTLPAKEENFRTHILTLPCAHAPLCTGYAPGRKRQIRKR